MDTKKTPRRCQCMVYFLTHIWSIFMVDVYANLYIYHIYIYTPYTEYLWDCLQNISCCLGSNMTPSQQEGFGGRLGEGLGLHNTGV